MIGMGEDFLACYMGRFGRRAACLPFAPADPSWALWLPSWPMGSMGGDWEGENQGGLDIYSSGSLPLGVTVGWLPPSTQDHSSLRVVLSPAPSCSLNSDNCSLLLTFQA